MAICTRKNTPSFFELPSMLLTKENHACAATSTHADNKMLYTETNRPCGHGGRGGLACNGGGRQEKNGRHNRNADNSSGHSTNMGSHGGTGTRKGKSHRIVGTLESRAIERVSARQTKLIRTRPDLAEETQIGIRDRTMQKAQGEPEQALPSS